MNTNKVNRIEIIDEQGRLYSKHNCSVELSLQDNDLTLKVFIKPEVKLTRSEIAKKAALARWDNEY